MRPDEVEGVLAHEVAHIANGDMVTMTLLQGVMNAFVMFFARVIAYALTRSGDSRNNNNGGSYFLIVIVLQIVLGILGSLIVNWFSRYREFKADHGGATLAGRERMIGALRRLAANHELVDTQQQALATMKINGGRSWAALFSTHPPLEERIAALENLSLSVPVPHADFNRAPSPPTWARLGSSSTAGTICRTSRGDTISTVPRMFQAPCTPALAKTSRRRAPERNGRHPLPSVEALAETFGRLGISRDVAGDRLRPGHGHVREPAVVVAALSRS